MSSPEEFSNILDKYPSGFKIHLVHAKPSISPGDRDEMSPEELSSLENFLQRMDELRRYAQTHGIQVVEVEQAEDNLYDAGPQDRIVTAGCYGDMCVVRHTIFLKMNDIKAVQEPALCLIL